MTVKKMIWEFYDEDSMKVVKYHDETFVPGTDLEVYVETLFDLGQIDDAERIYLLEKYVHQSNVVVNDGVLTLQFAIPEKILQKTEPEKVSNSLPPPPKPKTKKAEPLIQIDPGQKKVKPTPPPPPPPKIKPKPGPLPRPTPEPSPSPRRRLHRYTIPVHCTQNSKKWNCMVQSPDKPKEFETPPHQTSGDVEIAFLIDTSGSMSGEMEAVKRSCIEFARIIEEKGANVRLALIGYGIYGRGTDYSTQTWQLSDAHSFQQTVNEHLFVGLCGHGGCNVAGPGTARVFDEVISVFSSGKGGKMSDVTRYIVHISDEYDYSGGNVDMKSIIDSCKKADAIVHTMGCNRPGHTEISRQTGGEFWDIENTHGEADLSGILENVSQSIAHSVSLNQSSSKAFVDGPECSQYNSSPIQLASGSGSSRSMMQQLKENEGYFAIREFECMYCKKDAYFVCNYCGAHNCRGTETLVNDTTDVVAEASCQSCGKHVKIVQENSVASVIQDGPSGKKGK